MKISLDLIETRLRMLIEEWIIPFKSDDFQQKLAHRLVEALHNQIYSGENGEVIAPHHYIIHLHPDLVDELRGSNVLERLPIALQEIASQTGILFLDQPVLRLEPEPAFGPEDVTVQALSEPTLRGNTAILTLGAKGEAKKQTGQLVYRAFLIVNGEKIFPLNQAVTNIGRRPDNHLVIDDPRVSRQHAQIRQNRGQFILFDLNSTGGTSVNGQRTHQHTLKPGDVISMAGIAMIFGEELRPDEGASDTTRIHLDPPPSTDGKR